MACAPPLGLQVSIQQEGKRGRPGKSAGGYLHSARWLVNDQSPPGADANGGKANVHCILGWKQRGERTLPEHQGGGMRQSGLMSLVEAVVNVVVGLLVAVATQIVVFPMFGLATTLGQNLAIGAIFTTVSLARSYVLRRVFEALRG